MNRARENVNQRAIDENARAKEQKHMMKDLHMSIFDARGKSKKKQIIAQDAWKDSFQQESRLPVSENHHSLPSLTYFDLNSNDKPNDDGDLI